MSELAGGLRRRGTLPYYIFVTCALRIASEDSKRTPLVECAYRLDEHSHRSSTFMQYSNQTNGQKANLQGAFETHPSLGNRKPESRNKRETITNMKALEHLADASLRLEGGGHGFDDV